MNIDDMMSKLKEAEGKKQIHAQSNISRKLANYYNNVLDLPDSAMLIK